MTHPLYLIEADFGRIGRAFIETDRDRNSRTHAISLIRSGEVKPIKVLEVCEDEGTVRDVTADILEEADFRAEVEPVDLRAIAFDHAHDTRKHEAV